jgi:hypothetical protein
MSSKTKTIKVIVYPDGSTSSITRSSRGWAWYPPKGGKWESSDLRGVADNCGQYGGRIETRPNPYYRAPNPLTGFEVLNAALTKAFSARRR